MKELKNLTLDSYLIKPIQRLAKYILLIKEVIKHTDNSDPDYSNLLKALENLELLSKDINCKLDKFVNN